MLDSFEVTKLCDSEHVSSHLITIGSFNILCELPLNPKEILNFKKSSIRCRNTEKDKSLEEKYIRITNLETKDLSNILLLNISNVPLKIHIILISCSECFMGLPIFSKYFDISETQIVCTKLTYTFSLSAVENLQTKENYLPQWNEEEKCQKIYNKKVFNSDEYFDLKLSFRNSLHLLSYKEKICFQQNEELIYITPYSSGYSLGSCNFLITTDLMNIFIINKSSYNIKRHPSPLDLTCLEKADFVLFTSYLPTNQAYLKEREYKNDLLPEDENLSSTKGVSCLDENLLNFSTGDGLVIPQINLNEGDRKNTEEIPKEDKSPEERTKKKINMCIEKNYKDSLNKICSIVLRTIKSKGCVLIPVDLHFLYFLELIELIGVIISKHLAQEEQVLIFTIIGNINNVIHQANLSAEWVEESRKKKCSKILNPQGPFSIEIMIKNNRLIIGNDINDISKSFRFPCVCFVQDSTLRFFESPVLFEKWAMDQNNSILLIDPHYNPISVLSPFHIYDKKINVFYCPLFWDLNETSIWDIINTNNNKKCFYLLPHRLESVFSAFDLSSQINIVDVSGKVDNSISEKNRDVENYNKNEDHPAYSSNINNKPHGDKKKYNIIYIYPLQKKNIGYNYFRHLNKDMHSVSFNVDGTNNLEKILTKIDDNYYCANVKCTYNSSHFGDFINESQMEKYNDIDNFSEQKNKKMDNAYLREKGVNLMFGSIQEEEFMNNLLQFGYNKNDLIIQHCERRESDLEIDNYLWCITINSINSKIICYTKYDIEVFTSHQTLRQQVKEIIQKITTTM
ncbi:hypothetical protein, conserved [Plasmodium gonderi]|uniref:Metallo-beta-lactamase domain-containing protein n=1 Tax=Plasmodium gonderi TaxID=77519 RepID=A0A1Y1JGQ8_PLAGO|nr:hypothetical protein, conserved [Plasmodium gonderi]GAW80515.1 hypothetical protein, conserved [Plasmodium gonderi]